MKKEMFEELLDSVREGGAILRGKKRGISTSRNRRVWCAEHSRTNQAFSVRVCTINWR